MRTQAGRKGASIPVAQPDPREKARIEAARIHAFNWERRAALA